MPPWTLEDTRGIGDEAAVMCRDDPRKAFMLAAWIFSLLLSAQTAEKRETAMEEILETVVEAAAALDPTRPT
jgi:hypothetical protein